MNTLSILKAGAIPGADVPEYYWPEGRQRIAEGAFRALTFGATVRSASSETTTSEHLTMADAPYQKPAPASAYAALNVVLRHRDQSEDRTLPRALLVAVHNPTPQLLGVYWAVYDRTNMTRVSVWARDQEEAQRWADDWERFHPHNAWEPVTSDLVA